MTLAASINFRQSEICTTDGPDEIYSLCNEPYPTTRVSSGGNSVTFGWLAVADTRNRNGSVDPRFAGGTHVLNGQPTAVFRLDLPSGDYLARLASYDHDFNKGGCGFRLIDAGGTVFADVDVPGEKRKPIDITGTKFDSIEAWIAGNTALPITTTGDHIIMELASSYSKSFISHLRLDSVESPAGLPHPAHILAARHRRRMLLAGSVIA